MLNLKEIELFKTPIKERRAQQQNSASNAWDQILGRKVRINEIFIITRDFVQDRLEPLILRKRKNRKFLQPRGLCPETPQDINSLLQV